MIRSPSGPDEELNAAAGVCVDGWKQSDKLWSNPPCRRWSWKLSIAVLTDANPYSEVGWEKFQCTFTKPTKAAADHHTHGMTQGT